MRYDSVANDVADKLNIPVETVQLIYKKLFMYMRDKISLIDSYDIKSREEFEKMKYSFNLQHLGKLFVNYNIIEKRNESIGNTADV